MMSDRKHLVSAEVDKLMESCEKQPQRGARPVRFLLLMFRHGLRVSEACGVKLSQVDTDSRVLHVKRLKAQASGFPTLAGRMTFEIKLNGALDDLLLYNRALSSEEIKRLYKLGR